MHPLKVHLDRIKMSSMNPGEFRQYKENLAQKLDVSMATLHRLHNPKQNLKIGVLKALRLEIATNGAVPATSVCDNCDEVIGLALQVSGLRRQVGPATGARVGE